MFRQPRLIEASATDPEKDAELVVSMNKFALKLHKERVTEVRAEDGLARSKVAWKLAGYRQASVYRLVALFDATALALNSGAALGALLAARALMETASVLVHFVDQTEKLLLAEDIPGLDRLADKGTFATRDKEWLKRHPEHEAATVLKAIDHINKRARGYRAHYDRLSERCHPNADGNYFMFARLDTTEAVIRFSEERSPAANRGFAVAGACSIVLTGPAMTAMDRFIEGVAELQHRLNPVAP